MRFKAKNCPVHIDINILKSMIYAETHLAHGSYGLATNEVHFVYRRTFCIQEPSNQSTVFVHDGTATANDS